MVGLPQSFCTPQKKNPSGSKHQMSVPRILVFLAFPIVCVSLGSYNCSVGVGKKLFILTGITMLSFSILFVVCSSLNTFILFFETEKGKRLCCDLSVEKSNTPTQTCDCTVAK